MAHFFFLFVLQDYLNGTTAGAVDNTQPLAQGGWLSNCTNRVFWLFLLCFTNMPLRSADQQPAFWVLYFSVWCAVSLRIAVQTASLWQRARWAASDTTSQTTHQTNTLEALSTLTVYHLVCVIREFIDISIILQLGTNKYSDDVVALCVVLHIIFTLQQYFCVFWNLPAFHHPAVWC